MGKKEFVSLASWPSYNEKLIDVRAIKEEELVKGVMSDVSEITRVVKITPSKIFIYVASDDSWTTYLKALESSMKGKFHAKEIGLKDSTLMKGLAKAVMELNDCDKKERVSVGKLDEFRVLTNAKPFLEKELKVNIIVFRADDPSRYDPKDRAKFAMPYRPAIYIE
jgi:leucyl-tRNA synthetase